MKLLKKSTVAAIAFLLVAPGISQADSRGAPPPPPKITDYVLGADKDGSIWTVRRAIFSDMPVSGNEGVGLMQTPP